VPAAAGCAELEQLFGRCGAREGRTAAPPSPRYASYGEPLQWPRRMTAVPLAGPLAPGGVAIAPASRTAIVRFATAEAAEAAVCFAHLVTEHVSGCPMSLWFGVLIV
jgi:hypothetical protein